MAIIAFIKGHGGYIRSKDIDNRAIIVFFTKEQLFRYSPSPKLKEYSLP